MKWLLNALLCGLLLGLVSPLRAGAAGNKVQILLLNLKDYQRDVVIKKSLPPLLLKIERAGYQPFVNQSASQLDVLQALQNPLTKGVILVGHPALELDVSASFSVLNSYLVDAQGRYLPKAIFAVAHPKLQFLALVTCHHSDIQNRYGLSSEFWQGRMISPRGIYENERSPIEELVSLVTGPVDVGNAILSRYLASSSAQSAPLIASVPARLHVTYRDLLSKRFSYVVALNGSPIGFLSNMQSVGNTPVKDSFVIPATLLKHAGGNKVSIFPDDPNRSLAKPVVGKVDDILLDQVIYEGNDGEKQDLIQEKPLHIGDENREVDGKIFSALPQNREELNTTAVIPFFTSNLF